MLVIVYLDKGRVSDTPEFAETRISETPGRPAGGTINLFTIFIAYTHFYHGPGISRAMVMWPPCRGMTDHFTEQTRTNMSQPGRRPGTLLHVLQASWSRNNTGWAMGLCRAGPCFEMHLKKLCLFS